MTDQQKQFFLKVVPAAQDAMKQSGVPASVTIAQAILESGWGQSGLTQKANNFFGIKALPGVDESRRIECLTAEYIHGVKEMVHANFAKYASVSECFSAHTTLLAGHSRYQPAMVVKDDPIKFAYALQTCGYSTSPTYGESLSKLIDAYNLKQYDQV